MGLVFRNIGLAVTGDRVSFRADIEASRLFRKSLS